MDKARMTIRFDRNGQPLAERPSASAPQCAPDSGTPDEETGVEHRPPEAAPLHRSAESAGVEERLVPWRSDRESAGADPPKAARPDERSGIADDVRGIRRLDPGPLNQFTSDFGAWSSPFEAEVERLEALIRRSSPPSDAPPGRRGGAEPFRSGYGAESAETPGDADSSVSYVPVVGGGRPVTRLRRPPGGGWLRLVATVSAAVLTGLMFGWFALSLITDGKLPGLAPAAEPAAQPTADGEDAPSDGRASNGETAAGTTKAGDADEPPAGEDGPGFIEVDLPTRTYFVLQHGIFSTPEAARSAQAALEDLGFAGVGEQRERIHVYAGLAVNRSDADALKRKLEQAEAEVYVKEYAVPAVRRIRWTGGKASGVAGGTAADYFHAADELVGLIARLTAVRINAGEPMPFDAQSIETIGERHRAWSAHAVAAAAGLQEEDRETLERMDNAVNTAVMLLAAYNRNPASSYLWQAQAAALQYVLLENGLLAKIAAD